MIGIVLYSYPSSFQGDDGKPVDGFKTGSIYRNRFDKPECREFWTRVLYSPGSSCKVIQSQSGKWYCFPPEDSVPVYIPDGGDLHET